MNAARKLLDLARVRPLTVVAIAILALLLVAIVLLALRQQVTMTVDARTETLLVRIPDCREPQIVALPPGWWLPLDTENIDIDADPQPQRYDRPTLLRIQGPAELQFYQAPGGGFTISGTTPIGSGVARGGAKAAPTFQVKDDRVRFRTDTLSFSSTNPTGATEVASSAQSRQETTGAAGTEEPTAEWTLPRFALRGELVIGSPLREPNWDDEAKVAAKPGGLLAATVLGREGGWPSDHRFEVIREELELGDQLFTDEDEDSAGPLACRLREENPEIGHARATVSVVPDPDTADGRPHRFHVIAHARRQSFLVRRGGGAEFRIGASALEVLAKHSIAQTLWAVIIIIALVLTLVTDLMALTSSRTVARPSRAKPSQTSTRRKK